MVSNLKGGFTQTGGNDTLPANKTRHLMESKIKGWQVMGDVMEVDHEQSRNLLDENEPPKVSYF
jgi:hypothetical protein